MVIVTKVEIGNRGKKPFQGIQSACSFVKVESVTMISVKKSLHPTKMSYNQDNPIELKVMKNLST